MTNPILETLTKEQLIELVEIYSKNWLAHDGLWFQSIEQKLGMDEAMHFNAKAWERFTVIEAKRIKEFLKLPERAGLDGLLKALQLRFYGNLNDRSYELSGSTLVYRQISCRVQSARERKGLPFHPCKSIGMIEYPLFARVIDERISCRCISCYPDCTESPTGCAWEFTIEE